MPHKIYWDDTRAHVIRIDVSPPFTWKEYNDMLITIYEMVDSVDERVDIIADMRNANQPPDSKNAITYIKRGRVIRPDNYGITVNVGTDIITKSILDTGVLLGEGERKPRPLVDTIEEAYAIIDELRAEEHND